MTARRIAGAVLAIAGLTAGCGGSPRDLGEARPSSADTAVARSWTLVEVEGIAPAAGPQEPVLVEIDPDGRTMTVFFTGGDPQCYAVAGVDVARRDPELPTVAVRYGMRLGVTTCNAGLASLAIRVPLVPPFAR